MQAPHTFIVIPRRKGGQCRPSPFGAGFEVEGATAFVPMMIPDALAMLAGLEPGVVDGSVDRVLHRLIGLLDHFYVVILADHDDLADVAIFLHVEDDAHV